MAFDLSCKLWEIHGQHLYWKHQGLGRLNGSESQGFQVVKQFDESDETAALFPQRSFSNNNNDYFKQVQKKKKSFALVTGSSAESLICLLMQCNNPNRLSWKKSFKDQNIQVHCGGCSDIVVLCRQTEYRQE